MADGLARGGPLGPDGALFEAPGVRVGVAAAQPRWLLQGGADVHARAAAALGLPAPAPLRAHEDAGLAMLWLGPDETLWIASRPLDPKPLDPKPRDPAPRDPAPRDPAPRDPAARLREALAHAPHALVEVGDREAALDVEGPAAEDLLACAVLLDLHESAFPVGACARTLFGKAPALLWRRGPHAFRLLVPRSFAPYARDLLREGLHGLGHE